MSIRPEVREFMNSTDNSVNPDQFTNKFLSKRLWQYKKVRLGRNDHELLTLADIYRNLDKFVTEVCDTMDEMVSEITAITNNEEIEIFFTDVRKKLVLEKDDQGKMFARLADMENSDWEKALAQFKLFNKESAKIRSQK